jgi:sugar lactone lactonase YvrE
MLYIADRQNDRVRRLRPDGIIETVAGTGSAETQRSGDGGPATTATLRLPRAVTRGVDGSLYIADTNHYTVRRVAPDGTITRVAGTGTFAYSGDGGPAVDASFSYPTGVAIDTVGSLYVADFLVNRIRRVDVNGTIDTIAGNGQGASTGDGGPANAAAIDGPQNLAIDIRNRLIVGGRGPLRAIDLASGIITSIAGSSGPVFALHPAGDIAFITNRIQRLNPTTGIVTTVAGTGQAGFDGDGGPATLARFNDHGVGLPRRRRAFHRRLRQQPDPDDQRRGNH